MSNVFTSRSRKVPSEELANESRSTHITVAADMVFSLSHFLSGVCINFFSRRLIFHSSFFLGRHCRFCAGTLRCFMGRDSVVWSFSTPKII